MLMLQAWVLPERLATAIDCPISVGDTVVKVVIEELEKRDNLVYMCGNTTNEYIKISKNYGDFNPKYPIEFWNGYLTILKTNKGGRCYIWSKNKIDANTPVDAWCISGKSRWEDHKIDGEYLDAFIPIIQRDK